MLQNDLEFEEWSSCLYDNCGHYYGHRGEHRKFMSGHFKMFKKSGIEIADIACNIDRIERTRKGILRDDAEHIFLLMQKEGNTRLHHNGHTSSLDAGDFVLLDSTKPAELFYRNSFSHFYSAHIPRADCLQGSVGQLEIGKVRRADHPLAEIFKETLCRRKKRDEKEQLKSSFLNGLIGIAFGEADNQFEVNYFDNRQNRFEFIERVIDQNLCDPELSLAWLAKKIGMSTRQLQREFHENGTSFTHSIANKRLRLVSERLRQAAHMNRQVNIAVLSFATGFGDVSHFNRMFKRKFDCTPTQYLHDIQHAH